LRIYDAKRSFSCREAHFIVEDNFISDSDLMFRQERFIEKSTDIVDAFFLVTRTGFSRFPFYFNEVFAFRQI